MKTNKKAISLIVLVLTIIVLTILATTVIINLSNTNIIEQANDAVNDFMSAQNRENLLLSELDKELAKSKGWLPGKVSGNYIIVRDVIANTHDLKVTLTSDTITDFSSVKVSRYSTNLLDISQMLQENMVDNGDGTYTFTYTENNRFSNYCNVNIPAGVPFDISINWIEWTLSQGIVYVELTFDDGTKEYPNTGIGFTTYEKSIIKVRFFVTSEKNTVGQYVTFNEPKINIGVDLPYEEYVEVQTATAKQDGSVTGLTSISPNMVLVANEGSVNINCEYREKVRQYDFYGKTIVNFGDSIFGNYSFPNDISTYITEYTGATVYNVGFGGTRMSTHNEYWNTLAMFSLADAITIRNFESQESAIETNTTGNSKFPAYFASRLALLQSVDFNEVDIITLAFGTNDFTGGKLLDNVNNDKDTTTYAGALRYSIETIQAKYPDIEIVLCTPMYRFWMDEDGEFLYDSDTYEISEGKKLTDFVQVVKDVGEEYDLLVIDNYYELGINRTNYSTYFSANDGTHPNAEGRKLMGEHISKELYENLK